MFKSQPLKHVLPFSVSMFVTSIILVIYPYHGVPLSFSQTLSIYLTGVLLSTIFSMFALWLGLGFSHRVPIFWKSVVVAATYNFMSFLPARILAGRVPWYIIFFTFVIAFPLIIGAFWPAAWSNKSFKADASGAA